MSVMSLTYVIKESFSNSESFEERLASVPFFSVQNQTEKETRTSNRTRTTTMAISIFNEPMEQK